MGQIKIPRITTAQRIILTLDVGEIVYDTTNGNIYKGNGATAGGVVLGGGGDALTTNPLSQFAATSSSQLLGVISDETGSGSLVFATSPTLITPTLGVASAKALSFSSTTNAGLTLNKLTTTQRQALTPALGDKVYDITIGAECVYNGTFWEYELSKVLTSTFTTTSTTMVNITGFTFPVEANSSYLVEGVWVVGTNNTSGYTIGNDLLASAVSYSYMNGVATSLTTFQQLNNINGVGNATLMARFVSTSIVRFSGFLSTAGTAGNINMQIKSGLATNTLSMYATLVASGLSSYTTFKKVG